jgi:hypothetical protein
MSVLVRGLKFQWKGDSRSPMGQHKRGLCVPLQIEHVSPNTAH